MKVQQRFWSSALWIWAFCSHFTATVALPATDFPLGSTAAIAIESENLKDEAATSSDSSVNRHGWPPMVHHDFWNDVDTNATIDDFDVAAVEINFDDNVVVENSKSDDFDYVANSFENQKIENNRNDNSSDTNATSSNRDGKVLHIFPVPVDGECLADDGRRIGTCFNAYECRQKGGRAKGECAMGFGVCCVFIAKCNSTISNNLTYLVSPQFPSFMPNNLKACSVKIKLMAEDISQLRFDFSHFSLGQPNRRTGICDGDVFNVSGGPGGTFSLCGQNSGQHIYYDVGGRALPRQTLYGSLRPPTFAQIYPNLNGSVAPKEQVIEINMNFAQRFLPIRLWEIRIAQIPFSQRAPAGCLQYHFGNEGIIQTFNFADNGRHLANQHYRVCMRQETEMCSIMYQPCDEQSFRIGPNMPIRDMAGQPINGADSELDGGSISSDSGGVGGGLGGMGTAPTQSGTMGIMNMNGMLTMPAGAMISTMMPAMPAMVAADDPSASASSSTSPAAAMGTQSSSQAATTASMPPMMTAAATTAATMPSSAATSAAPVSMTTASTAAITQRTTQAATPTSTVAADEPVSMASSSPSSSTAQPTLSSTLATTPLSDDVEGSGDGDDGAQPVVPLRRPRPVSGGFDLLGFLRSAFDINLLRTRHNRSHRQQRQIYSTCSDRITLPCIIEDFIGTGLGPLPSCEPVHCGNRFCASGVWPCRIESTVTPFFMNIHFGEGVGKGSAEDNIGACLRFTQVQCM